MRPLSGDTPIQGTRASDGGAPAASQQPTMTFTRPIDESAIDDALQQPLANFMHVARDARKQHVQQPGGGVPESVPNAPPNKQVTGQQRDSSISTVPSVHDIEENVDDASRTSGSPLLQQKPVLVPSSLGTSQAITPLLLATSGPASAVSGLSSPRGSVAASLSEETGSQALSMSMELEPETYFTEGNDRVPQLVMPSINLPSRRPFTDEGKRIGRLKVLIAGDAGKCLKANLRETSSTDHSLLCRRRQDSTDQGNCSTL